MPRDLVPPDPPLLTANIGLRPFDESDLGAILEAGQDADIIRHTFMPEHPDEAIARKWLENATTGCYERVRDRRVDLWSFARLATDGNDHSD